MKTKLTIILAATTCFVLLLLTTVALVAPTASAGMGHCC
jgi:hypothetical protein